MEGWHADVIKAAGRNFEYAEELLRVQQADMIDAGLDASAQSLIEKQRPLYGSLQKTMQEILGEGINDLGNNGINRIEAAPLASADALVSGVDFLKFSVPGSLLELKKKYPKNLDIKLNCTVQQILNQEGDQDSDQVATGLATSCGNFPLNGAKLILAMGTLPPTTLVRNSFGHLQHEAGETFSAHFISAITARVPRKEYLNSNDDSPCHQVWCDCGAGGDGRDQGGGARRAQRCGEGYGRRGHLFWEDMV